LVKERAINATEHIGSYAFTVHMNRTNVVKGYRVSMISSATGYVDRIRGVGYMNVTLEYGGNVYRYNYTMRNWTVYCNGRVVNVTMDVLNVLGELLNRSEAIGVSENSSFYVLTLKPKIGNLSKAVVWLSKDFIPKRFEVSYERRVPMVIRIGNLSGGVTIRQLITYTVSIQRVRILRR